MFSSSPLFLPSLCDFLGLKGSASQYIICRLCGRGFVCWGRPRAGRPGLSGRGMRRVSRRTLSLPSLILPAAPQWILDVHVLKAGARK